MRARTVYESISFTRGMDPKRSLKIGASDAILDDWIIGMIPNYEGSKMEAKRILSILKKIPTELREIYLKFRDNYSDAWEFIENKYRGEAVGIHMLPPSKDYIGQSSVLIDINDTIGVENWHWNKYREEPLPKEIVFKKVKNPQEHLKYLDHAFFTGTLKTSWALGTLAESKEYELYSTVYYKKDPDIFEKFTYTERGRWELKVPGIGGDQRLTVENSDTSWIVFRAGKNWVRRSFDKSVIGCINFIIEHPDLYDSAKMNPYFVDLLLKEHPIKIV